MSEEMRTFGYLCPACGQSRDGRPVRFALEASNAEIECSCGKSSLDIGFDGEKYHITVPCGICGETHTAICGPERILQGATALGCAPDQAVLLLHRAGGHGGKEPAGAGHPGGKGKAAGRRGQSGRLRQ
ncbi:MAG: hypothetical protein V8R40_04230 [Dysosmobacter sp.]